jgi:hypothetical protein
MSRTQYQLTADTSVAIIVDEDLNIRSSIGEVPLPLAIGDWTKVGAPIAPGAVRAGHRPDQDAARVTYQGLLKLDWSEERARQGSDYAGE